MKPLWCPLSQTCLNCLLYPRLNTKVEQILSFDMLGLVPRTEFLKWPRENHHHKKNDQVFRHWNPIQSKEHTILDPPSFRYTSKTVYGQQSPIGTNYEVRYQDHWWLGHRFCLLRNEDNKRALPISVSDGAAIGDWRKNKTPPPSQCWRCPFIVWRQGIQDWQNAKKLNNMSDIDMCFLLYCWYEFGM